ncbi:hypothetical protein Ancab_020443 [Ancistrocladus abbreviatus]
MDGPFFGSSWNDYAQPSSYHHLPNLRGIPVKASTISASKPKVVSIPVHFVGSVTPTSKSTSRSSSESESALKVQKAWRGLRVRKNMKKILVISKEVDEIEKKILARETVELIQSSEKERLKVNEMLMALLIRLDSIGGVDVGVRDCRKALIRRTIMLQEKVDSIIATVDQLDDLRNSSGSSEGSVDKDQKVDVVEERESMPPRLESKSEAVAENADQNEEINDKRAVDEVSDLQGEALNENDDVEEGNHQTMEVEDELENSDQCDGECKILLDHIKEEEAAKLQDSNDSNKLSSGDQQVQQHLQTGEDVEFKAYQPQEIPMAGDSIEESLETEQTENNGPDSYANSESSVEGGGQNVAEKREDEMEIRQPSSSGRQLNENPAAAGREENKRNGELLERMMEDNEKMMALMAELFERNEMQTRMLSSLSLRVEQLEKAFACDRLRRKKKNAATCMLRDQKPN